MRDALELETRRRIYAEVSRFPGTYLRELQRALGLQPGQLEYHLDVLVKAGLLSAQEEGGRKRYFVAAEVSHPDKAVIGLLRQRAVRRILLEILVRPGARFQEILAAVGGAKSTLSFHLRKVTDTGLVLAERAGRERAYRVADEERVAQLLITHRASFLDEAVDRFAEVWLGLGER